MQIQLTGRGEGSGHHEAVPDPDCSSFGTVASTCVYLFSSESNVSACDPFCNSTVFAPDASAESIGRENEPNKDFGLILEILARSCRFSEACKNSASTKCKLFPDSFKTHGTIGTDVFKPWFLVYEKIS